MTVEIGRAELGGIPVYHAPAPPPYIIALAFRAGRSDETAARGGLTHLVEHMALPFSSRRSLDFNGTIDNVLTTFVAAGDEDLVLPFIADVALQLRELPLERFEIERGILLAEEAMQGASVVRLAYALRFGPAGHGLVGYDEYGLRSLAPEDVTAWSHERFVAGNPALWVTSPEPPALDLQLLDGPARPPPVPTQLADPTYPCFYGEGPWASSRFPSSAGAAWQRVRRSM
jgi:zinc protease